jgi:hypothetical protein
MSTFSVCLSHGLFGQKLFVETVSGIEPLVADMPEKPLHEQGVY